MSDKIALDFTEITQRLKALTLPDVDLVVGIATGGVVPASLAAYQLNKPLTVIHINYRAEDNIPRYDSPILLSGAEIPAGKSRILLVDDVSVTGKTLDFAKSFLEGREIFTLVMKGAGDFVAFPEVATCVQWPWKVEF
jgi:hypoxanthine phosphoribosyltransferase